MTVATPHIIVRKESQVGWIILNKVDRHNAMSSDMWAAIPGIIDDFEKDHEIRSIVVTGSGNRAFVSGADISEFEQARSTPEKVREYDKIGQAAILRLANCSKPTIARIRGYCVGGGVTLALACDIRIGSSSARFAVPAAKLGLGYPASDVKTLLNIVSPAFAKEIFYTGRLFAADEALAMGLINRLLPDTELDAFVDAYCAMIGQNAPLTIHAIKRTVDELTRLDGNPDLELTDKLVDGCFGSDDYIEGRRAFLEKRRPVFRGR